MDPKFQVFDLKRIFIGNGPHLFILEIIFRTVIMYAYTIFLLRILGKRGMGQLSTLELAIIICFGSAVGDPMIGAEMPIVYGVAAITTVAMLQIGLERVINRHKPLERIMEGQPNLVVDNGIVNMDALKKENLSHEDLFRVLRGKDVQQLGEIHKAFFETSGQITVWFHSPKKVRKGLSIMPENEIPSTAIYSAGQYAETACDYSCMHCGHTIQMEKDTIIETCLNCGNNKWLRNSAC
jgi:uncharacterized membrane protein YcaP (DUF421 family)